MPTTKTNQAFLLLQLHQKIRGKLTLGLKESEYYLDDIFDDLTVEELALLSAKINNRVNRLLNPEFDF